MASTRRDKVGVVMFGDAWGVRVCDSLLDQRVDEVISIVKNDIEVSLMRSCGKEKVNGEWIWIKNDS